jgi:uncharacterized protein with HEPN domain
MREEYLYLNDILQAIEKILKFTEGMDFEDFKNDILVFDAVARNFEIVGEASIQLSDKIKADYEDIPWQKMRSMRNIVAHEYFGLDKKIIWTTIQKAIPELKEKISNILKELES